MQEATQVLVEEHEGIKRVLSLIERANEKVSLGKDLPPDFLPEMLDFIKTFADTCHHGKEEGVLFPLFEKKGLPRENGPIGMMLVEHDLGREQVKEASLASDRGETRIALEHLEKYAQILKDHIEKENNILYPMGNQLLASDDHQYLQEEFAKVEEKVGQGKHEAYHRMIGRWEKTL